MVFIRAGDLHIHEIFYRGSPMAEDRFILELTLTKFKNTRFIYRAKFNFHIRSINILQ